MGPNGAPIGKFGCVGLYDRVVKKSVLGVENRPSHIGPGRSYMGLGGSKYASKSIPASILTSGTGLDGSKWGPNWQIWLLYGLYARGVKKSTGGVHENEDSPSKCMKMLIFPFKMHQNAAFPL